MEFDANLLLASLLISSVGFVLFVYGKKQARVPQMAIGLILLGDPYFVSNLLLMFAIAMALVLGLWVVLRLGW
jgi:hypothetical protein